MTQITEKDSKNNTLSEKEKQRRINLAKAHLAEIGNSNTLRKEVEATEQLAKTEGIEAYWKLQGKLSRELASHLISYKGIDDATAYCIRLAHILNGIESPEEKWFRVRENVKEFLNLDENIAKSELLKDLAEKAIAENTMDGYYNLLKGFRKNYDEIAKIKGGEENADKFLENMTDVVHDKKSETSVKIYGT